MGGAARSRAHGPDDAQMAGYLLCWRLGGCSWEPMRLSRLEACGLSEGYVSIGFMVRPGSWSRPAGGSPVRVDTGVPGSRPRFVGEIRRAERGVESLFGGSNTAGRSVQANFAASSQPQRESRAAHITAKAMSVEPRSGVSSTGLSGVRKMARGEGLGRNRRGPSVHAFVGQRPGV